MAAPYYEAGAGFGKGAIASLDDYRGPEDFAELKADVEKLVCTGYTPQLLYCAHCTSDLPPHACTFSPPLGGLLCPVCAATAPQTFTVSPEAIAYLRRAMEAAADVPLPTPLAATAQQDLERLLHAHLTFCLGRELKSYAFLHL